MFNFFRRPGPRPLTGAIMEAMVRDGQNEGISDLSTLRMVESTGRYSDRKVTYFRVFDPTSTAQRSAGVTRYQDFDVFPGLIVRSGHVEKDGVVVLTRAVVVHAPSSSIRTRAGRAVSDPSSDATTPVESIHPTPQPSTSEAP